jgi:hypothetical protein
MVVAGRVRYGGHRPEDRAGGARRAGRRISLHSAAGQCAWRGPGFSRIGKAQVKRRELSGREGPPEQQEVLVPVSRH